MNMFTLSMSYNCANVQISGETSTFILQVMYLADASIQSDLQCIQYV